MGRGVHIGEHNEIIQGFEGVGLVRKEVGLVWARLHGYHENGNVEIMVCGEAVGEFNHGDKVA